jgi:hypothetical protein
VADFLDAEQSDFHDENLIKATQKIREALAEIPADPLGRKLSIIRTKMGILLAWVQHGADFATLDAVTSRSDDAVVIEALRLRLNKRAAAKGT